ncbi:hypothetical protein POM88_045792 [Heracleum sosnowskyi]|uniref:Uncharacterized protein n=1 Tax=Heracleum sosnowskyi TaxID=360622 RepID=A0AAD8H7X9_9APIA|nr:hypothetical protein POM88_045792 [Heracleum sosnowskyi]
MWLAFLNDDQSLFLSPHLKDTKKCMFVFSKLSKHLRSTTSTSSRKAGLRNHGCVTTENTSKKTGCGTWDGKTTRKQIRDDEGNFIVKIDYLVFEINETDSEVSGFDTRNVGLYRMHEVTTENLTAIHGGGVDDWYATQFQELDVFSQDKKETINTNLEGPDSVTTENLTTIHDGVDDRSGATQIQELDILSQKKEETINKNLEGPSSVTIENLSTTHGDVDDQFGVTQYQELDVFSQEIKEETMNKNLEGPSSITEENQTAIHCGFYDRSAATQFQDLDAFYENFGFDELGSESFCLGDLGDISLSFDGLRDLSDVDLGLCFDVDWFMECLDSDPQEKPVEDKY